MAGLVSSANPVLDAVQIVLWGYALYLVLQLARKGYGGVFTSTAPYFVGATALFFLLTVIEPLHLALGGTASQIFLFSIVAIQVVAGLLLVQGLLAMYNLNFATIGFMDEDMEEDTDA